MIINWLGIIFGIGFILLGNAIEGGHLSSLIQPTAAMIVFGGTLGATLISSTMTEISQCIKYTIKAFLGGGPKLSKTAHEIIELAQIARKDGLLALEPKVNDIKNPFLKMHLRKIIDGFDPTVLKEIMEDEVAHDEESKTQVAKVLETAGGFSPTVGIIGAVLGLIHVMSNLSDPSKLGSGIAVAFVATVYGVGSANLVFLPIANKLKKIVKEENHELVLIYYGLIGLQSGMNPRLLEEKLNSLAGEHGGGEGHGSKEAEKKAA